LADPGAYFDVVNFGAAQGGADELVDVTITNHVAINAFKPNTIARARRHPAERLCARKRKNDYPARRVGEDVYQRLRVFAIQQHGALAPEADKILHDVANRAAVRRGAQNQNAEGKKLHQYLLRRVCFRFWEDIGILLRFVVSAASSQACDGMACSGYS
jgi:hypothetical protein